MRRRRIVWAACHAALLALVMGAAMAGRAAAQSAGTPWLGVTTQEITSDLREGLDYRGGGVLVSRVVVDSPAERAGIRKGDVIVGFNSRAIDSPEELVDVVRSARVGQTVAVTVVRNGSRRSLSAHLAAWPEGSEEELDTPEPAPEAPRAPRAPSPSRSHTFEWDGDTLELPDDAGTIMLRSMGRGRLGVRIQDLNADLGEALGVPDGKGVLVTEVLEDTPAARVRLKAGDVITQVADRAVDDVNDLHRALQDREGRVRITVVRRGARRTVEPELAARPEVMRLRRGDGTRVRIPDIRTRVLREHLDSDAERRDLEGQLRELRQELRDLRQKLEAMEKN